MSASIDDLTIAYSEDGTETTRELGKHILSKGAWTTILFRYQDWDNSKNDFGPVKYSIRRYQKRNNQYWMKSKFNISSEEQARKIIEVLTDWLAQDASPSA
ncbi:MULTISPECIES: hypothetical protein [Legionella]|uniref:Uncharacterized protein n=1 Tax=Legionella maceachernii TaxID=466 RepID=A0A0W0VWS2_9GAMM|nr:hypothetical protein [Legionella maceachernii]KTD24483.1 hypothetical protein Lmac_2570 [Legionella maceachernii]SJZ60184.1 hypothetical protein SAMN02745128_00552 [Legionella maceachernii]SUP00825.1 Uncharacterised protein [Legionella maceachernii]